MDRRVVEFFQRLPAIQCVSGGWTKSVLRRSMTERLPAAVVWNPTNLTWAGRSPPSGSTSIQRCFFASFLPVIPCMISSL